MTWTVRSPAISYACMLVSMMSSSPVRTSPGHVQVPLDILRLSSYTGPNTPSANGAATNRTAPVASHQRHRLQAEPSPSPVFEPSPSPTATTASPKAPPPPPAPYVERPGAPTTLPVPDVDEKGELPVMV